MKLQFIVSDQTNPYWNIAVENYLMSLPDDDIATLYLWRNHRTVVIGQNQNPFSECNVEQLEADGGYLMRRRTGSGAVYHDDGNLNFSFVMPKAVYDLRRQFAVIQRAVADFGIVAELSGRNDILTEGRKFSGNAFSKGRYKDLHHGTLLIKGNMEDLQRYLRPKPAKLQKHGVASVQSRVVNLSELNPEVTSESIVPHLRKAFETEYSERSEYSDYSEIIKQPEVRALYEDFASPEWKYGRWRSFTAQRSAQFDWGGVELSLTVDEAHGVITDVQLASDALDLAALDLARRLLTGASTATPPPASSCSTTDPFTGEVTRESWFASTFDNLMRHTLFGVELNLGTNLFARLGYSWRQTAEMRGVDAFNLSGFSFGVGLRRGRFEFSYARRNYHLSQAPNYLTLSFRF